MVGGYEDARGDAAKNSMSLLKALHQEERLLELRHFCVGAYNTKYEEEVNQEFQGDGVVKLGPKTAILRG